MLITSITEDVLDLPDAQRFALLGVDESAPAGGRVFAILDAGVLVNLVELAESRGAVGKCLFKGDLAEELQDQAPYLFALGAEDKFTENVLGFSKTPWHFWGRGGALFFTSDADLEDVYAHWRKFTRVKDVRDKFYYFRFWEPDMLLSFLEACTADELQGFFGGDLISDLYLPLRGGDRVAKVRLETPQADARGRAFPIRTEHFNAFAAVAWSRFLTEMMAHTRSEFGGVVQGVEDDALRARIDDLLRRAHGSYGLTQTGPQKVFLETALEFGDDFDTALPWASKVLRSPNYSGQMPRARALQKRAAAHVDIEA